MRRLLIILAYGIGIYTIIFLHLTILYALPSPWNTFHLFLAISALHIAGWPSFDHLLLVCSIFYAFAIDAFGASIFGLQLIAIPLTVYALSFLYYRVFTNRSWYSTAILAGAGVILFRVLYLILLYIFSWLLQIGLPQYGTVLSGFLWEIIITTSFTAVFALILALYSSKFRTDNQVYWQS